MIKSVFNFIKNILELEMQGFYYLFLIISRGFFFVISLPFLLISKITKSKTVNSIVNKIDKMEENPVISLVITIIFCSFVLYKIYIYVPNEEVIKIEDNISSEVSKQEETPEEEKKEEDYNLYRKFSAYKMSDIDFSKLREINGQVVSWLIVDGTDINYPIVQAADNEYYLSHDINNMSTINGWTFVDYRNDSNMNDDNTIFYGHNLFNKTAFGSISNLFTDKWYNTSNHKIIVLTESNKYTYEVFSVYYSAPDSSYLKYNFNDNGRKQEFFIGLKEKSEVSFSVDVTSDDRIITLSTCTDDNSGRKVVHAKLVNSE